MMKTYALISGSKIAEIIEPMTDADGNEIPIDQRFTADFVGSLVDVTGQTVSVGYIVTATGYELPPMPQGPTFAEQAAQYLDGEVRPLRERILNRLSGIGFAAAYAATPDMALVQEVIASRQALLDITRDPDVLAATALDGLKAAVLAAYHRITSGASVSIVNAFEGVDQ